MNERKDTDDRTHYVLVCRDIIDDLDRYVTDYVRTGNIDDRAAVIGGVIDLVHRARLGIAS